MAKGSGLTKKLYPSDQLAEVLGSSAALTRGQVMKKLWAYIKKHELQDEKNKRVVVPDDLLAEVIGSKPIDMFKMTKKISEHLFDE